MLVSVEQARIALRYDENDPAVAPAIEAASAAVLRHLNQTEADYHDSNGEITIDSNGDIIGVPSDIQRAVIYLAGYFLRDPTGVEGKDWDQFLLPRPVVALLYTHRLPTLK
jgi:hypothetical protein